MAKAFVKSCVGQHFEGKLSIEIASMAKYLLTDLQGKLMNEYPIARLFRDARVQRIYGGTNEIMKLLIARSL